MSDHFISCTWRLWVATLVSGVSIVAMVLGARGMLALINQDWTGGFTKLALAIVVGGAVVLLWLHRDDLASE